MWLDSGKLSEDLIPLYKVCFDNQTDILPTFQGKIGQVRGMAGNNEATWSHVGPSWGSQWGDVGPYHGAKLCNDDAIWGEVGA